MKDDTNFRVQVHKDGHWHTMFEADFASAMAEVRKFRQRGVVARFSGNGTRRWDKRAKPREYRAVR